MAAIRLGARKRTRGERKHRAVDNVSSCNAKCSRDWSGSEEKSLAVFLASFEFSGGGYKSPDRRGSTGLSREGEINKEASGDGVKEIHFV